MEVDGQSDIVHNANIKEDTGTDEIEDSTLSQYHSEYLLQRHGTLDLNPLPSSDPLDPLNWPRWRKNLYLVLYGFHGMMATFISSGLIPVIPVMAKLYGKPVSTVTYITSTMIAMFGVAPFFWLPFMNSIGRRPALLISVLGTTAANIGSIFCKTFGQQLATCCAAAFFAAPPTALGSTVVAELYFQHQRGAKTGLWKAFWNIGAPGGPFLMGFVAERAGIKWVFGVFALANFALFIAYFIFAPETLYSRQYDNDDLASSCQVSGWRQQMRFKPVHHGAWSFQNMVRPFKILTKVPIMLPVCAYVLIFAYTAVAVIITVPQVAGEKFHLGPEGIGLQFIAFIVGFGLGEILSGPGSDLWMKHCISRRKGVRVIEDRLWLAYIGIVFSVVGLVVWGVTTQQASSGHWVVWPNIGMALDAFGCQILTTVLITYAIDVDPTSAGDTGLILNLLRQEYGFVGPFYYPAMFQTLGYGGAAGVLAAAIVVVSGTLIVVTQFTRLGARTAERAKCQGEFSSNITCLRTSCLK